MISSFQLRFGRVPGSAGEPVNTTPVTVFVGPNNSGKSRVLTEIEQYCRRGQRDANARLLADITFSGLRPEQVDGAIGRIRQPPNPGEAVDVDHLIIGSRHGRQHVPLAQLTRFIQHPTENLQAFCSWFLNHNTLILDGKRRINLIGEQATGDLQLPPQTSLQVLFHDNVKRLKVRRIVAEAFGTHFVIDPTHGGNLRVRLAVRAPTDEMEELGLHPAAIRFHAAAQLIDQASDGVKAFTGIITELLAGDPSVVLIDEPEAFLHPSLASKLGSEVSRAAADASKRVFISTHSAAFVMGCIESGAPVTIIRLTYRGDVPTARILPSPEITELMRHPLLRSTGVLSGLFYEFVVVTESDADRAFYQEVNSRLLQFRPEWGIPNCLFINAQNKQTIHTIIRPLRKLGIPAVGIVDVDVLKEGGQNWARLLESASVPAMAREAWGGMRAAIKNAMDATGQDMKTDGGLAILQGGQRETCEMLFRQLAEYGIFVVPGGELESWMRPFAIPGHGPSWLIAAFERMGEDPDHPNYIRPNNNDVWEFLSRVKTWLVNANRNGIPG